jgi:hypothetical protein
VVQWSTSLHGWVSHNQSTLQDGKLYNSQPVVLDNISERLLWKLFLDGEKAMDNKVKQLNKESKA